MPSIVDPPSETQTETRERPAECPECDGSGLYPNTVPGVGVEWVGCPACEWCGHPDGQHENGCRLGVGPDEIGEVDAAITTVLHERLASWFGDDRQAFLAADLVPVVERIVGEFRRNTIDMARKAAIAETERDDALAEVERLRDMLAEIQAIFDLQCPPMLPDRYVDHGAWMAHSWWNTVLGNILKREALLGKLTPVSTSDVCDHEWLDRPESDTRECLICGTEVAG